MEPEIKTVVEEQPVDNRILEAQFRTEQAASIIMPQGSDHVGSIVLHIYESKIKSPHNLNFQFITQFTGLIPEALAIEGAKVLKERMMARYGHILRKRA